MRRAVNPKIIETIRELSEDPVICDFLTKAILEESKHLLGDKQYWRYTEYYLSEIERAIDADKNNAEEGSSL